MIQLADHELIRLLEEAETTPSSDYLKLESSPELPDLRSFVARRAEARKAKQRTLTHA